ncbi:MAG: PIN domain-containing protein, partial [Dehalococcoidia bacterium]
MITAVLDTNVLASGFAGVQRASSTPGELIRSWHAGLYGLVLSNHIFAEISRTFRKPYFRRRLPAKEIAQALLLLQRQAIPT